MGWPISSPQRSPVSSPMARAARSCPSLLPSWSRLLRGQETSGPEGLWLGTLAFIAAMRPRAPGSPGLATLLGPFVGAHGAAVPGNEGQFATLLIAALGAFVLFAAPKLIGNSGERQ